MIDLDKLDIFPIDNYFEHLKYENRNIFCVGQLVCGFVPYPLQRNLKMLDLIESEYDPTEKENAKYYIKDFDYSRAENQNHRPIVGDTLESSESYIVQKGKIRPCIILNKYQSRLTNPLYDDEIFLCVPLFTFKRKHNNQVLDIIKFNIPDCMFLPKMTELQENSIIRFSRIVPLAKQNLKPIQSPIGNKPISLSDEAFQLMSYHLSKYLSLDFEANAENEELLECYREIIDESTI